MLMDALNSFSFEHPGWTGWFIRIAVTAVAFVGASLVAHAAWDSGWNYQFIFAALFS
jgi:hypothetical protein